MNCLIKRVSYEILQTLRSFVMKKFMLILVVLSIIFASCPGPHDPVVSLTFEEAVQEVYEMAGRTLFYSTDGKTMDKDVLNRITGPNEIPGVCTDYAIEFAYYWNEVKNYDELFGKAYFASVASNSTNLYIKDGNFVPDGTSKLREESGNFGYNANIEEMDGVYRDIVVISIVYSGKNILHYGDYQRGHMWVVINVGDDWYDTDPTAYDIWGESRWNYYAPIKIIF